MEAARKELLKKLDEQNKTVTSLNDKLTLINKQILNRENLVELIYNQCNIIYDKETNLVSRASINGGKFKNWDGYEQVKCYDSCVRFDYIYDNEIIKVYIYDTDAFIITGKSFDRIQIDSENPKHYLAHLVFNVLLNGNAINYITLPEEIFPIGDPEYYGSRLEKL